MRLLGSAVLAMIAFAACGGPPGMPKVPPPEYEDEPMPDASAPTEAAATAATAATSSVGVNGACTEDTECAAGLKCTCLGIGPQCPPDRQCATCGQKLCVDPSRPPPPPPSPPPGAR